MARATTTAICTLCLKPFERRVSRIKDKKRAQHWNLYCSRKCFHRARTHRWIRTELKKFLLSIRAIDIITECWLMPGKDVNMYRALYIEEIRWNLGRVSIWAFRKSDAKRALDGSLCVCHRCDVPACFNPKHLFMGTHKENTQDMISKGRNGNMKKTHCPQGHSYSGDNLSYFDAAHTRRRCRTCHRDQERRRHRAKRRQ